MAARAGNANDVLLVKNQVLFGLLNGNNNLARLQHSDLLAVSTMQNNTFMQQMLASTAYEIIGSRWTPIATSRLTRRGAGSSAIARRGTRIGWW